MVLEQSHIVRADLSELDALARELRTHAFGMRADIENLERAGARLAATTSGRAAEAYGTSHLAWTVNAYRVQGILHDMARVAEAVAANHRTARAEIAASWGL